MSTMTREEIERGLVENRRSPGGAARNAHAEALSAAAEASGDRALFREALDALINAYLYSSESPKMLVPFARLLQEYDKDPGAFSEWDAHSLFWQFKWIATAINDSPEVPLESATGWLDEMERRYRIAGYTERPVRESELWLADAIGDDERAGRAYARWQAADRDNMSDCHACELNGQGHYAMLRGNDAEALEVWQPVLSGDRTCAEEPHRVLATALLPLVRLGRFDEARSAHLRGYRLARGNESLLPSIGRHIEFCALTGNESRGLEILADHAAHVAPLANLSDRLAFHGGVLVLLRRLKELGHGQSPAVPYEGVPRTVSELYEVLRADSLDVARRFDARNGTARGSERFLERIDRAPLVEVLPLGVRSPALGPLAQAAAGPAAVPAAVPAGAAAPAGVEGFTGLVERARAARDLGHPGSDALWAAVSAYPEAGADPLVAADVADHRALTAARAGADDAGELLAAVRDGYRALGQAERAALAELRLATLAAQSGAEPAELRKLIAVALRAAEALEADEPLRIRRIAFAELTSIRVESYLRSLEEAHGNGHGHDHGPWHGNDHGHGPLAAELGAFVESYEQSLPDVIAEAEEMLGRLALSQGDPERAVALLAASADRAVSAGRPWLAVDPLVLRAGVLLSLGHTEEAEEAARSGLAHAAEVTDPATQGVVRLTLTDILLRQPAEDAEAVGATASGYALEAAHWFDQAGLTADGGAQARLLLARAYAREGRTAEAAEVLQSTLPDLLEHGEGQAVSVREFLGDLLRDLNDPRAAAEQYLLAADVVKDWEDPRPQAGFAQAAADQLSNAQLVPEAVAAYERALELRRETKGAPIAEVRILRSLAWLGLRGEVTNAAVAQARTRMDEAADVLVSALAETPEATELRAELAETWNQLAQVLDRRVSAHVEKEDEDEEEYEDAAGAEEDSRQAEPLSAAELEALRLEEILLWERASALHAELGPEHLEARFQCVNNAAWTDHELGRRDSGAARISALADEIRALPKGTAPEWMLPSAERSIESLLHGAS